MLAYFAISVWSMLPNKKNNLRYDEDEEDAASEASMSEMKDRKNTADVEMTGAGFSQLISSQRPPSDDPVMTPRTQAFARLDRQLPLRRG